VSTAPLFDRLRDRYDEWYERNRVIAENEARLVSRMMEPVGRPVVEVGVGTGFFAARLGVEAGLDPSMGMLERALKRLRGSLLVAGRGERMPFRSGYFSGVLIVVTLCFVDSPAEVLGESLRILRLGGRIVSCIVPADSSWGRHYARLASEGHPFYSAARFLSRLEHLRLLEAAGFAVEEELGVLSFKPWEAPVEEEPMPWDGDLGFICVRARKDSQG
jgi:ubiquinone/menaquinone biosynthesis C-methylase UbiE